MQELITKDEMLRKIKDYVEEVGTQHEAATHLNVSQAFLSDVLRGRREISASLCERMGYERDYWFMPKSDG